MLRRLNLIRLFVPLCLLGLVLLGAGGKLCLIQNYGSDVPFQDMWVGIGEWALRPWQDGHLTFATLLHPHNEHRIALTRALSLAEVWANGQWDNRLETVVNAFLHGLALAGLVALLAPRLPRTGLWTVSFLAALLVGLPFAWENTLVGFQSQFFLLLLLVVPGVWWSLHYRPGAPGWFAGLVACALALFTIASGLLAAVAVAGVAGLRAVLLPERRRDSLVTAALAAAIAGVGGWLYEPVAATAGCHAANLGQFLRAFANQLTFPLFGVPWLVPLLQLPVAWWLVRAIRDPDRKESLSPVAGLFLFALLHGGVLAWARGGMGLAASPRYNDIQALGLLLNAAALAWLWHRQRTHLPQRLALTAAWTVTVAVGLQYRCDDPFAGFLPNFERDRAAAVEHFRRFVATGDRHEILDPPDWEVGMPGALRDQLASLLSDPRLQPLLPVSIRHPVYLRAGTGGADGLKSGYGDELPDPGRPAWLAAPARDATDKTPVLLSRPIEPSDLPMLRFRVAGDFGTPRFPLALRSMTTGETCHLLLDERTGLRWRTVNLDRPPGPAVLVLGPSADGAWGALTAPVEMGLGSWYASKLAKNWPFFVVAGAGCFAAALVLRLTHRARPQDTYRLTDDGTVRLRAQSKNP